MIDAAEPVRCRPPGGSLIVFDGFVRYSVAPVTYGVPTLVTMAYGIEEASG